MINMKLRITHSRPRVILTSALSIITISIACTYKSAGSPPLRNDSSADSQPLANGNTQPPPAPPTGASTTQDRVPCTLNLAGASDIKGIKLGMTGEGVLALFPGSKEDAEVRSDLSKPPNQFGGSSFVIRPEKYEWKDKFPGISRITFTLLDGRISTFTVSYNGPEYSHVDKFVAKFVEGTNLPAIDQWESYVGMDTQMKTLKCADFEIRIFAGGKGGNLNYVLAKDLEAEKKLQEREKKAEEKATPQP
jgi:hypothetical protein